MSLQQIPLSPSSPWPAGIKLPPARNPSHRELGAAASRTAQPDRSSDTALEGPARENSLVQRAIGGDAEALEELFSVNINKLRKIAFTVLRNKEDAEDALQNAFLSAHRKLATFKGQSRFSTWLTSIVLNSALMALRKNNLRPESSLDEIIDSSPSRVSCGIADSRKNPEQAYAEAELKTLIEDRIRRLPRRLQTAFRVHMFTGMSVAESSAALGVQPTTFKARVFRARQHVTRSLRLALRLRTRSSTGCRSHRRKVREFADGATALANGRGRASRVAGVQRSFVGE